MVTFTFRNTITGEYVSAEAHTMRWALNIAAKQCKCALVSLQFVCIAQTVRKAA
jgi:hypothetical protein